MKKLLLGIIDFRQKLQKNYMQSFGQLASRQSPDALFVACSDSRVVPNTFASTNPGDLFILRNVGNLIPPCGTNGISESDESEAAAIEFAVLNLQVSDIIICGHSECGAMQSLLNGRSKLKAIHLRKWLRHADSALKQFKRGKSLDTNITTHNQLSQLNVLQQIEHVKSYPAINQRILKGQLTVHGWWFDISKADVYTYDDKKNRFVLIDEAEAEYLIRRIDNQCIRPKP